MADHKYGTALVLEGEKVVGIFTTHDIVQIMANEIDFDD